jgi:F-type H+-transporting ATPase subunit delta
MSNPTELHDPDHFEADIGSQHVARVYAEALLQTAAKGNKADDILAELHDLVFNVMGPNPQLAVFFADKTVSKEKKADLLQKVFPGKVSDLLGNFLLVLNEHERLQLLHPILQAYIALNNERAKRVVVQVRSAVPLQDHQRERLTNDLRQAFRLEPQVETQVDPDLLGGLVVRVGDWLYDASVKNRLESVQNQLNERSLHGTTAQL